MKCLKQTIVTILSLLAMPSIAQANDQPPPKVETAPKAEPDETASRKTESGGYGAPEVKLTSLASSVGLLVGSQGGWILNHHFVLGGAGYGLVNDVSTVPSGSLVPSARVKLGYGGVRLGGILGGEGPVHFTGGVLLGGAAVGRGDGDSAGTWAIEPDAGVEATVTSWLRVSLAGSYRFLGAADEVHLRSAQLSGPAAGLAVKLGSF